jgi:hypothetical protein
VNPFRIKPFSLWICSSLVFLPVNISNARADLHAAACPDPLVVKRFLKAHQAPEFFYKN